METQYDIQIKNLEKIIKNGNKQISINDELGTELKKMRNERTEIESKIKILKNFPYNFRSKDKR